LEIEADTFAAGLKETNQTLRKNLQVPRATQKKYPGRKQVVFDVGETVYVTMRHFQTTRPSQKLDYKQTGLYTGYKVINKNAYKFDLLYTIRKHNMFHISLLDR
jgi:hypothetical protein